MNAQFALGARYADELEVFKNETEAGRWYRLAAEQGDTSWRSSTLGAKLLYRRMASRKDHAEAAALVPTGR